MVGAGCQCLPGREGPDCRLMPSTAMTVTAPSTRGSDPKSSDSSSTAIGAGIGAAVVLLVIIVVIVVFLRRRRKNRAVDFMDKRTDTIAMETVQGACVPGNITTALIFPGIMRNQMAPYEVAHSSIVLESEIGRGEFGVVMKGIGLGLPGCDAAQAVAVKVLKEHSHSDVTAFIKEGLRLKELSHENVVSLLGVCFAAEPYYIVLEYMPFGDLKTLLRQCQAKGISLFEAHLLSFALDASRGFEYLQQRQFVHRDLAARNVLVSASFVAKISDFGMARRSYRSEYYAASESRSLTAGSLVLPMRWMAPESYFDGTWDLRSDVWMFGVLLWGMLR